MPWKYKNGGKIQGKVGTSQHNKGWSDEGLHRFNEIFDSVQENRNTPYAKEFEEEFRNWCEEKAAKKKKKKVAAVLQEPIKVRHELWSDNEDETVTTNIDTSKSLGNKVIRETIGDSSSEEGSGDEHADEDSEDEAPCPDDDSPAFCEV